jgi:hypothetical protein
MKMLYFAMVHSHIVYCINVFSCANITTLSPLKLKQKEAIRIVCNAIMTILVRFSKDLEFCLSMN